jgi:hypothetical protein
VDDFLNEVEKFFRFQKALYGPTRFLSAKTGEKADKPVPVKGIEAVSAAAPPEPEPTEQGALADFYKEIHTCTKCALGHSRTKFVFGYGSPDADLMFVGEAPGRDEDLQGKPFVGRAGQLLTLMLQAIDLRREDVFIANVLKCRPPNNRDPLPEEIEQCEPYLLRQIALIKPKLIVALGRKRPRLQRGSADRDIPSGSTFTQSADEGGGLGGSEKNQESFGVIVLA